MLGCTGIIQPLLLVCLPGLCYCLLMEELPEFRCPFPCDTRKFPHYDSCQFYWQCSTVCQHTNQTCDDGKHFSYVTQSCETDSIALQICNKYSFRCSWSSPTNALASCSNDTVIAVSRVDLLSVNKTRCPDTVPDKCCAIPLGTCYVTSHPEQTERARTACDGRPTCSVTIDEVQLASGCVADGYYLHYRCLYIPDLPSTTTVAALSPLMTSADEGSTRPDVMLTTPSSFPSTGIKVGLSVLAGFLILALILTGAICKRRRSNANIDKLREARRTDPGSYPSRDVDIYEMVDVDGSCDPKDHRDTHAHTGNTVHISSEYLVVDNDLYGSGMDKGSTAKLTSKPKNADIVDSVYKIDMNKLQDPDSIYEETVDHDGIHGDSSGVICTENDLYNTDMGSTKQFGNISRSDEIARSGTHTDHIYHNGTVRHQIQDVGAVYEEACIVKKTG